ncbi:MAG: TIGR03118 family protein, partial [Jatrophihabitantaceae bacterium]
PDTPVWVSDNGADVATLYHGAVGSTPVSAVPLVVSTPGGAPTGQAFNDTTGFRVPGTTSPALFVFAGENGDLSAWNQSVSPPTSAVLVSHVNGAVYKGLALVHSPFGPLVLATDFHHNRVDVFDSSFRRLDVGLLFRDRHLPRGYAPFGIAAIGDHIVVTYARQNDARHDDVSGRGHGFVDVFTTYGAFVRRLVSRDDLNSPWGLTLAPPSFGRLAGDLLVGNFGDGRINAYDARTGAEAGVLRDAHHRPIVIDGLWGLLVGDPSAGGTDAVWFSAGPDGEAHGLLGVLRAG